VAGVKSPLSSGPPRQPLVSEEFKSRLAESDLRSLAAHVCKNFFFLLFFWLFGWFAHDMASWVCLRHF
jgi:hypothetical protein